ncbi:hypothetical protein KP509_12G033200 [Ceratopteris richardii]|uniref:RING-type domain-containing protein n=1 Tax=Ceratopteris richardii TaxID=49495 RepID=A0A8T2TMM9_CERRI|nr:hypothetical protein KP509_12G033200 [Ceratopteris richardii]
MSSSSSSFLSCTALSESSSFSSSAAIHGSPSPVRVFNDMYQTSGGSQHYRGSDEKFGIHSTRKVKDKNRLVVAHDILGTRSSNIDINNEDPTDCRLSVSASEVASSASTKSERSAAVGVSLNPFASEFVPCANTSSPGSCFHSDEGFLFEMEPGASGNNTEDGGGRVSESISEAKEKVITINRSRELARVLQQGQIGQGRTESIVGGSQRGTDALSNQPVSGPGKRGQFVSANHLLNFQYDPITRSSPVHRVPYPRRAQKIQPFDKELFLQANFRFLVSDFGDYLLNSLDPDKMLQWEDIAAVSISAPVPIQCPICLEVPPVCPQITSCGHIFCFPCILRFFVMGSNEKNNEFFKKCPLCFAMTSSKALRTVFIDAVHNYCVGDMIEFTLLNRSKGSIIPYEKEKGPIGQIPYSTDGLFHPFSKFTLISDIEQTVNKAITELSKWAERAQNEGGEDVDLIPFCLLAIEHLQSRRCAWNEHRASEFISSSPPVRQRIMAQVKEGLAHSLSHGLKLSNMKSDSLEQQGQSKEDVVSEIQAAMSELKSKAGWVYENAFSDDENSGLTKSRPNKLKYDDAGSGETVPLSSSWEEIPNYDTDGAQKVAISKNVHLAAKREDGDGECCAFFQSADGQPLIMHPLNMKCLLQHYGSYENLPCRLQVRIIEMEAQTQTESLRKRYRYLSHLPLTTNFWFCEVDLRGILPSSAFTPFNEEIRSREARRRRRQKQEQADRLREKRMLTTYNRNSSTSISLPVIDYTEDMPALVSEPAEVMAEPIRSMEVPTDQRKLFSNVTRLGFASAHDAPGLTHYCGAEPSFSMQDRGSSSSVHSEAGGKSSTISFADIIQAQPLQSAALAVKNGVDGPNNSVSRKKKKSSKVLLSTAGGRRY